MAGRLPMLLPGEGVFREEYRAGGSLGFLPK